MKILIVIEGLHPPGYKYKGISVIYEQLKHLAKYNNIELHVLTTVYPPLEKKEWFEKGKKLGIIFHTIDISKRFKGKLLFVLYKLLLLFEEIKLLKRYKFDIIHEYISSPILSIRGKIVSLFYKTKFIHTLCTFNEGFFGTFRFVKLLNLSDKVIVLTKNIKRRYSRYVKNNKLIILPLGFNLDKFSVNYKIKKRMLRVLYLGPFEERKGVFTFIKAAKLVSRKAKKIKFILAGYNSSSHNYRNNIKKIKSLIDKSIFEIKEGFFNVPRLMSSVDVFVLPQDTPHGTLIHPLTLIEAMSMGLPVVASDTEGVNDLIENNINGLLFRPRDYNDLSKKIIKIINNKHFANFIGNNAKKSVEKLNVKLISNKLYHFYKELLK